MQKLGIDQIFMVVCTMHTVRMFNSSLGANWNLYDKTTSVIQFTCFCKHKVISNIGKCKSYFFICHWMLFLKIYFQYCESLVCKLICNYFIWIKKIHSYNNNFFTGWTWKYDFVLCSIWVLFNIVNLFIRLTSVFFKNISVKTYWNSSSDTLFIYMF